jgi:hypothetical protein
MDRRLKGERMMRKWYRAGTTVMLFAVLAITLIWSSLAVAAYEFEVTMERYAAVDTVYALSIELHGIAVNTGTEADTLDFLVTFEKPAFWDVSICVEGVCVSNVGEAYLAVGDTAEFYVQVLPWDFPPGMASMVLTCSYRNAPGVTASIPLAAFADLPSILLVDDDAGASYETYMETAVEAAGYKAHVYDADTYGRPTAARLLSYWAVLWTTADGNASYITAQDEQDMMTFLNRDGVLFLSSMDFLSSRAGATTFTTEYLHVSGWAGASFTGTMGGDSGDPISDGMSLDLTGGPFSTAATDGFYDGTLASGNNGTFTTSFEDTTGKRVEDGYKLVFHSFPFECVSTTDADPNNQNTLMSRIFAWFDPPTAGVDNRQVRGDALILHQNSPNPFGGSTQIAFVMPGGARQADLEIYNVQGQVVRSIAVGPEPGTTGSVAWDGTDNAGQRVASGVYFYKLSVDGRSAIRSMVLLK